MREIARVRRGRCLDAADRRYRCGSCASPGLLFRRSLCLSPPLLRPEVRPDPESPLTHTTSGARKKRDTRRLWGHARANLAWGPRRGGMLTQPLTVTVASRGW